MSRLLVIPKLNPADLDTLYNTLTDDGYWETKKVTELHENHTLLWSLMRFRDTLTDTPYYLFPDGTVTRTGSLWTDSVQYAANVLGYPPDNRHRDVYDRVPQNRFPELLDHAAAWIRSQGEYQVWVEPVEDPFTGSEGFVEPL